MRHARENASSRRPTGHPEERGVARRLALAVLCVVSGVSVTVCQMRCASVCVIQHDGMNENSTRHTSQLSYSERAGAVSHSREFGHRGHVILFTEPMNHRAAGFPCLLVCWCGRMPLFGPTPASTWYHLLVNFTSSYGTYYVLCTRNLLRT